MKKKIEGLKKMMKMLIKQQTPILMTRIYKVWYVTCFRKTK